MLALERRKGSNWVTVLRALHRDQAALRAQERTGDGTVQDESETSPRGVAGSPGAEEETKGRKPTCRGPRSQTMDDLVKGARGASVRGERSSPYELARYPGLILVHHPAVTVDDALDHGRLLPSQAVDSKPRPSGRNRRRRLANLPCSMIVGVAVVSIAAS